MTNSPWAKTVVASPVKPMQGAAARKPSSTDRIGGLELDARAQEERDGRAVTMEARRRVRPASHADTPLGERLPMREAELKARDTGAPDIGDDYYAIAVYGIPRGALTDDSKERQDELKKLAALKREGKKDLRPTEWTYCCARAGR